MEDYLCNKDLLYKYQFGLRRQLSTESHLLHLTDYIRFEMDKGNFVGMNLLDLQKAFNTVDHSILSMKLQALGLNKLVVSWFSSYLSDRHLFVDIFGTFSTQGIITCGVPQGSILGPSVCRWLGHISFW